MMPCRPRWKVLRLLASLRFSQTNSATGEGVVHPHPTVIVRVAVALFSISGHHAWAARVAVGRKESVDPQFVMNLGGALTGHGVDGAVALKVGLSVEQSTAFNGGAHGVDERRRLRTSSSCSNTAGRSAASSRTGSARAWRPDGCQDRRPKWVESVGAGGR